MNLLIDTHALIWFCEGNLLLGNKARVAMEDESNARYISAAVAWELAIKVSLGKLVLEVDYDRIFPDVLEANGFQILNPQLDDFRGLLTLPRHHGDPFDRLMIVQALRQGLTIVSRDTEFPAYGVPLLW